MIQILENFEEYKKQDNAFIDTIVNHQHQESSKKRMRKSCPDSYLHFADHGRKLKAHWDFLLAEIVL